MHACASEKEAAVFNFFFPTGMTNNYNREEYFDYKI